MNRQEMEDAAIEEILQEIERDLKKTTEEIEAKLEYNAELLNSGTEE